MNVGFYITPNSSEHTVINTYLFAYINRFILNNKSLLRIPNDFLKHIELKIRIEQITNIIFNEINNYEKEDINHCDINYVFIDNEKNYPAFIDYIKYLKENFLIHGYVNKIEKSLFYISISKLPLIVNAKQVIQNPDLNKEILTQISNIFNNFLILNKINNIPSNNDKIKQIDTSRNIKLIVNWDQPENIMKTWNKMSEGDFKWKNYKLSLKNVDYYAMINMSLNSINFIPEKTLFFTMEPYTYNTPYYTQLNNWLKSTGFTKSQFLKFLDHDTFRNICEPHVSLSLDKLTNFSPQKTKTISAIVSSKYDMPGHKLRIDFLKHYQTNNPKYTIDIYGLQNNFNLQNYLGPLKWMEKDDGLFPYKYHIAAENSSIKNYFTEKITDAILSETLCFYWGCPNISTYIDPKAYILVDFSKPEEAIKIINYAIENDEWSKRIQFIRYEKQKILYHYTFFPTISSLFEISLDFDFYTTLDIQVPGINFIKINENDKIPYKSIRKVCVMKYEPCDDFLSELATVVAGAQQVHSWQNINLSPCGIWTDTKFSAIHKVGYPGSECYLFNPKGEGNYISWKSLRKNYN
jgi:hypothetical protein